MDWTESALTTDDVGVMQEPLGLHLVRESRDRLKQAGALLATLVLGLTASSAVSQLGTTDSHPVAIILLNREEIYITGGDVSFFLAPPTGLPISATDDHCQLWWWTNSNRPKNITVETDLAAPVYDLTVEARNINPLMMDPKNGKPGTSMGAIALAGTGAQVFIRQIQRCFGRCDLFYTATAEFGDPLGTETHTVTYTFVER